MNDYEVLVMLDPALEDARQEEIVSRAREIVEKGNGAWVAAEPWGRRRLAFEIGKKQEGVYHLLTFDAEPAVLDEVTRVLRITDGVMRHMATRRVHQSQKAPPATAVVGGEREEYPASSESEIEGGA